MTRDEILQAFDEISLRNGTYPIATVNSKNNDKNSSTKHKGDKGNKGIVGEKSASSHGKDLSEKKDRSATRRCYSYGLKDHVSSDCPTKEKSIKCFGCNEHGHIASDCPSKDTTKSCAIARPHRRKHSKDVLINDVAIQAIIDSDNDITIMREDEYIKLDSSRFDLVVTPFRGVGI